MQEQNPAEMQQGVGAAPGVPETAAAPSPIEPSLPPEAPTDAMLNSGKVEPETPTVIDSADIPSPEVTLADSAQASENVMGGGVTPPASEVAQPEAPQGNGFTNNLGPSNVTSPTPEQVQLNQDVMSAAAEAAAQAAAGSVNPAPATAIESPIGPPPASPEQPVQPAPAPVDITPPPAGPPPAA